MLDVHAPHQSVHTWKDFFIHIATISIGLLIAIGLEQTVEFVHHRRQAAEMAENLKQESIENCDIVQYDLAQSDELDRALHINMTNLVGM